MPKEKTHWTKRSGILIALAMLTCWSLRGQNEGAVPASHEQKALNISLDSLLEILKKYSGNEDAQAMAIGLIKIYGLGFRPAPQDIDKLRAASASVNLLKAIETAKLPPPKPVPKQGLLAVSCEPVDCDVSLDGRSVGSTSHGHMPWISHVEGPVSVSATKANYEATHQGMEATIRPDELTQIAFHLKLTRAGLLEIGAQRFQQMLQSLLPHSESNGNAAVRPITESDGDAVRAAGTLYLHGPDGRCVVWSVVAFLGKGHTARFELSRLREKHILISTETDYSWDRAFRSDNAGELEGSLRLFLGGQLPELMKRLIVSDLTMIAPDSGETVPAFRVEGKSQSYSIVLDSAYRPNKITIETADALSAQTIFYSDYVEIGEGFYPKTTQIILPDGVKGIEARFDTVQIAAMPASHPKRRGIFR